MLYRLMKTWLETRLYMNPVKIIFFDIDGTLVDSITGCIPEKTYEALHRLRENRILLCIATGRSPYVIPDFGEFCFDAYCTLTALCVIRKGKSYTATRFRTMMWKRFWKMLPRSADRFPLRQRNGWRQTESMRI